MNRLFFGPYLRSISIAKQMALYQKALVSTWYPALSVTALPPT